jgi:hypothetical protein
MTTASEVLPRTAASVLRSSASAWYARALSSAEPSPAAMTAAAWTSSGP